MNFVKIYMVSWRFQRLTKILSWNVTKWGLLFSNPPCGPHTSSKQVKKKHPVNIEFGVVTSGDKIMTRFIFLTQPHCQHDGLHQVPGEGSATLYWENGFWMTLQLSIENWYIAQAGKPSVWLWENFCDHITPNIWLPYFPDYNPIDCYVCGWMRDQQNSMQYQW